jgi:TPR repeat protein
MSCPGASAMTEARRPPLSRRSRGRSAALRIGCAVGLLGAVTTGCAWAATAFAPSTRSEGLASPVSRIAGSGVDIVRMPTGPSAVVPSPVTPVSPQPLPVPAKPQPAAPVPNPSAPIRPAQVGRLVKLPVKVGSLSTDGQKGWLGVKMDPVELPLALSLGLLNANGVFIVEATVAGPAALGGARFGDIVTAYNGRSIDGMNDLRQRVAATTPGDQAMLDVWRITGEDGDFLQALRRLAEGGNAYVMYRLGRMYAAGIGVARDENEAVRWYRKGAAAGNMQATTALAIALLEGRGTGKDPQEAIHLLKVAADKDNLDAMYRLGVLYAQGAVVTKDALEAVRLFTKASEAGHAPSMVDLGLMFYNGEGVQVDLNKAAMWYKRAADLGDSSGMVNLGYLHQQGKGVEQDDVAAVNLYRRAADAGNAAGIHNLASMYESGRGLGRKDPEQAADLVLRALELRNQFTYVQMTQHSNNWSRTFRIALQKKLRDAGFYAGRVDGNIRESTIAAINAYVNRSR